MSTNREHLWPWIVAAVVVPIGVVNAFWYFLGPVIPQELLRTVVAGTAKKDVVQRIGEPSEVDLNSWIYTRWGNQGYVVISFTDDGRVLSVNDESAFLPQHFR